MGLCTGAVFCPGGGARKQPIKQPTEMPTSTMALMGRFPSLMGRFLTLMGRFPDFVLRGRFTSWKSIGKQPVKKRGIRRILRFSNFAAFFYRIGSAWKYLPFFFFLGGGGGVSMGKQRDTGPSRITELTLSSRNAKGSRNPWVIKFHGRWGCWFISLQLRDSSYFRRKKFYFVFFLSLSL